MSANSSNSTNPTNPIFPLARRTLLPLAAALLAAACQPAGHNALPHRVEAKWPERQLLLVGDDASGSVRVFHLRAAPQAIAEIRTPTRAATRDIAIDEKAGRIWILGDGALFLHDGRSFSLIRRIPLAGDGRRLALAADGSPRIIDSDGSELTIIDASHLYARRAEVAEAGRTH